MHRRTHKMKLNTILLIIIIFLLLIIKYLSTNIAHEQTKTKHYQQNQNILYLKLRNVYDEKLQLEQQNKELTRLSSQDTFNWH